MKIGPGTLIYIEFLEPNNTWPTENYEMKRLSEENSDKKNNFKATEGIYNLGNTCYMNCALQCLANIKHMHKYFVQD